MRGDTDLLYLPFQECLMTRKEHISSFASVGEADPELRVMVVRCAIAGNSR